MKNLAQEQSKTNSGFTLIELLVTLSVLGILMAIAIPNMRDFIVGNRLSSNVNSFIGALSYARSEAIVRNKQVIVCPKDNSTNACVNTADWGKYDIQIFVDEDGSDSWTQTAGLEDTLLKTISAVDVSASQFVFKKSSGPARLTYQSGGYGTNLYKFDINVVNTSDSTYETRYGRSVCISRPGRARVIPLTNLTCPA